MDDLLRFVQRASEGAIPRVEEDLGRGFVRLHISEAERRQARQDIRDVEGAVLELLRNARDSGARNAILAMSRREPAHRVLTLIDDGIGIPAGFREAVFESRITSRLQDLREDEHGIHGRGMALFSIRQRADECRIVSSAEGGGTVLSVTFDLSSVPERTDQSTGPRIVRRGGATRLGSGPHNIKRVCAQFALDNPGISVYAGSPAEAMAAAVAVSVARAAEPPLFPHEKEDGSFWQDELHEYEPRRLVEHAREKAGLEISLRNAQRITSGELRAPMPAHAAAGRRDEKGGDVRLEKLFKEEKLAARIGDEDLATLAARIAALAGEELSRYYLGLATEPSLRRSGSSLRLTIELRDEDDS